MTADNLTKPDLTLVIIAAGLSRRYGRPKALVPVGPGGEILMDYSIHDGVRSGIRRVVVVTRPELHVDIERHFRDVWGSVVPVEFTHQELSDLPAGTVPPAGRKTPWGTGHAVLTVESIVHNSFLVINCDDFYGREAFATAAAYLRSDNSSHALMGYRVDETLSPSGGVSRAACSVDTAGRLTAITEVFNVHRTNEGITGETADGVDYHFVDSAMVSMNCWAFRPSIFAVLRGRFARFLQRGFGDLQREFLLSDAINDAVRTGDVSVQVLPAGGHWFGITHPEDHKSVSKALETLTERRIYPSNIATV